jgi:hypothetical protein
VLAAAASLALGGCVSKPVLELYGARVAGVTPQGVTLLMTMKVNNDNSFDVKVRNVRANVSIQHEYMLPYLQYDPEQWLASDASTLVPVPMTIPWPLVTPLLTTSVGSPMVQYHMHGYADVTATRLLQIERNDYMLDEDGAFSRLDLVVAAGRGLLGSYDAPLGAPDAGERDAFASATRRDASYPPWLVAALDSAPNDERATSRPSTASRSIDDDLAHEPLLRAMVTDRGAPSIETRREITER